MEKSLKDYTIDELIACDKENRLFKEKEKRLETLIIDSFDVMYPEKIGLWSSYLWIFGPIEYYSAERAFEIMKAMEEGFSIPEAIELLKKQKHRDGTMFYTSHLVEIYAKNGPDFADAVEKEFGYNTLIKEDREAIRLKNKMLELKHSKEKQKHSL